MLRLPSDIIQFTLLPLLPTKKVCTVLFCVSRDLTKILRPETRKMHESHMRRKEQLHLFSEDALRFEPHTFAYLEDWCTAWAEYILDSPWWSRPPRRERGALVDAKDFQKSWCPSEIIDWRDETRVYPPLAPHAVVHPDNAAMLQSSARVGVRTVYKVRFLGWNPRWDEWLVASDIKAFGSRTYNPVRRRVVSCKQWMLRKHEGVWDLRLVQPHAVTSVASSFLPVTDVLSGLLVQDRSLYGSCI